MSEITNPSPNELAAAQENASGHDSTINPPLDGDVTGAALDDHLNPNPDVLPGSAEPWTGSVAGSSIENPPPWIAATEPAAPEHEAPPLGPLNPPTSSDSGAAASVARPTTATRRTTAAKPKTAKRATPAKKTRK